MRILFAVPSYWPSQDGVANITGYLAGGLAERGHQVFVLTSAGNGGLQQLPEREEHGKVQIERMRVYVRWPLRLKGRDEQSSKKAYLNRIERYQPDVLIVVCSQTWTFDWIKSNLDEVKCPKVFYSHGYSRWREKYPYWELLKKRNVLGAFEQYLCKRYYDGLYKYIQKYDLAIYLSNQNNSAKYAELHGLTNGRILENAIDDVFFEPGMKHKYPEREQEEIRFLFIANYSENKNHEMLIDAYSRADIGKSSLIFAGFEENDYLFHLKAYTAEVIKEGSGKKVLFHVHLERGQIVDLYRRADVFVCPSKSETWSIVAHEAAAAAMPIISTDVGIYSEISGALIIGNVEEMKGALEQLYLSREERKCRGELAYQWICSRQCRTKDKIDALENELKRLTMKRGENE